MSNLSRKLLDQLVEAGYVTSKNNKFEFTRTFYESLNENLLPAVPGKAGLPMFPVADKDWELKFMELISRAQVPARCEDTRGNPYYTNRYSEPGLKAFKKAIMGGVDYELLIKSTMLYYKSNVRLKKAVGNYFADGLWKTDYEALKATAETGVEEVNKYIKSQIDDGSKGQYRLG